VWSLNGWGARPYLYTLLNQQQLVGSGSRCAADHHNSGCRAYLQTGLAARTPK
jgi:hypothetical protein